MELRERISAVAAIYGTTRKDSRGNSAVAARMAKSGVEIATNVLCLPRIPQSPLG